MELESMWIYSLAHQEVANTCPAFISELWCFMCFYQRCTFNSKTVYILLPQPRKTQTRQMRRPWKPNTVEALHSKPWISDATERGPTAMFTHTNRCYMFTTNGNYVINNRRKQAILKYVLRSNKMTTNFSYKTPPMKNIHTAKNMLLYFSSVGE